MYSKILNRDQKGLIISGLIVSRFDCYTNSKAMGRVLPEQYICKKFANETPHNAEGQI